MSRSSFVMNTSSIPNQGIYRKCPKRPYISTGHDAIAARDAHAVIPPRKNAKMWKPDTPEARARNEAVRSSKYLGRALWRRWSGYHRRSRVETKMHCVKLLGQRLSARDFNRQVAEIQIRAAILNGSTALGIPCTAYRRRRLSPSGVREAQSQADLCNKASGDQYR
jgi:hypothetical protein